MQSAVPPALTILPGEQAMQTGTHAAGNLPRMEGS